MLIHRLDTSNDAKVKVLYWSLQEGNNELSLVARREDGKDYYVLYILPNGRIRLIECISEDSGLDVDQDGCIIIEYEE